MPDRPAFLDYQIIRDVQKNPYAEDLGLARSVEGAGRHAAQDPEADRGVVEAKWEKSYAPGKWSARRMLVHLAQAELALTTRVRFAASQDGYVAQPFDQDAWLALDDHADAATAVDAYVALRRLNLAMFKGMTPKQRKATFTHPEYGLLTPEWVAAQLAGHDIHHFKQLKQIA